MEKRKDALAKSSGRLVSSTSRFLCGLQLALALAILFACRVSAQCDDILAQVVKPLVVSAIFSLVASTAYGEAWKAVAKSSPANLAKFYLAALVIKMVAGTLVFLVYVLTCEQAGRPRLHRHLRPVLCRTSRVRLHLLRTGREKSRALINGSRN